MTFNETRYQEDFVKKHLRAKTLPDDLLERYAVQLPIEASELTSHLRAVRAYWNKKSTSPTPVGKVCMMCRSADEELRKKHGAVLETPEFWRKKAAEHQTASAEAIAELARQLKESFSPLGVVTASLVERYARPLSLGRTEANAAVAEAGLTVTAPVAVPDGPPIGQFSTLVDAMGQVPTRSVPALVHKDLTRFGIVERFSCPDDPALRLDAVAVDQRLKELDRSAVGTRNNAIVSALRTLNAAAKRGVELRDIALYHLVYTVEDSLDLPVTTVAQQLEKTGLVRRDSAVLALSLRERTNRAGAGAASKVTELLGQGRLNEARQALFAVPAQSPDKVAANEAVAEAERRLADLLSRARKALAAQDEATAAALLREASTVSVEDAAPHLEALPPAPPAALQVVAEGAEVRLFWQPATGHDETTTYVVTRQEGRVPADEYDGTAVYRGSNPRCRDEAPPVARPVHYAVRARSDNGIPSRPANAEITVLPPISGLATVVGPSEVGVRWQLHPGAETSSVGRRVGESMAPVPTAGRACTLAGLPEGQAQYLEIRALYRSPDGHLLPSAPHSVTVTPRAEARPVTDLVVRLLPDASALRVRAQWTPVDNSEVSIRRGAEPPPWRPGEWVTPDRLASWGQEVDGRRETSRERVHVDATIPPGLHYFVALSSGGTGTVVGAEASIATTDPISNLRATPFADYATLAWEWPQTAQLAEVSWCCGEESGDRTVGMAEYHSQGVRVPLGPSPTTVEVRALVKVSGRTYTSAPVTERLDAVADGEVAYHLSTSFGVGRFKSRSRRVSFQADQGCSAVRVALVASPGAVMPTKPDRGEVVLEEVLDLKPGAPAEFTFEMPRHIRTPRWVRCFVLGGRGRLLDPPISEMKES